MQTVKLEKRDDVLDGAVRYCALMRADFDMRVPAKLCWYLQM